MWLRCRIALRVGRPAPLAALTPTQSSNSLVAEQRLITVYFPPVRAAGIGPSGSPISPSACAAQPVVSSERRHGGCWRCSRGWLRTTVLSVGLWLAALNVQYRDVRYTIPFPTQRLFITPVAYPSDTCRNAGRSSWTESHGRSCGRISLGSPGRRRKARAGGLGTRRDLLQSAASFTSAAWNARSPTWFDGYD